MPFPIDRRRPDTESVYPNRCHDGPNVPRLPRWRILKRRDLGPLLPGPRAPGGVNTYRLIQQPLETLVAWRERYGDLFTVPLVVFGVGVYVCDPEAIRELFTGDQSDLHAGEANEPLSPILGPNSVLILDGPGTCASASCCCRRFRDRRCRASGT